MRWITDIPFIPFPFHTTLHCTIPCHTLSHHTTPYHTSPYHPILYHITPHHATSRHAIPYCTILYHITPYHPPPHSSPTSPSSSPPPSPPPPPPYRRRARTPCSTKVEEQLQKVSAESEQKRAEVSRRRRDEGYEYNHCRLGRLITIRWCFDAALFCLHFCRSSRFNSNNSSSSRERKGRGKGSQQLQLRRPLDQLIGGGVRPQCLFLFSVILHLVTCKINKHTSKQFSHRIMTRR